VPKGYLFREGKLCVPQGSHRKLFIKKSHEGGLMGHFGVDKILSILQEKFYWSHMRKEFKDIVISVLHAWKPRIRLCIMVYTPTLPIASSHWKTLAWISSLVYPRPKGDLAIFLWLWIDLARCLISYHATS